MKVSVMLLFLILKLIQCIQELKASETIFAKFILDYGYLITFSVYTLTRILQNVFIINSIIYEMLRQLIFIKCLMFSVKNTRLLTVTFL